MDIFEQSIAFHRKLKGKIALKPKTPITNREELSLAYTPGVAEACRRIANDPKEVWELTSRGNWVAVVTDGTAVLGLGDIGPLAGLPVMEGKAVLFKEFADVDAFPICLNTKDPDEIIRIVEAMAPSFGGINLEDISAPRCFYIEEELKKRLSIPVFHDDQHGTEIVVLAGLMNALTLTYRDWSALRVVVSGAGAAGATILRRLVSMGVKDIVAVDSKGIISKDRQDLNDEKKKLLAVSNPENISGNLADAVRDRDVFIGVSVAGLLTEEMVKTMALDPIIFALANPTPEIMPDAAKRAGAKIVATGRSDFPNQVNNVLAFPGIFRGALDARASSITDKMMLAAAKALSEYVTEPTFDRIIPDPLDKGVAKAVAKAVSSVVER